MSLILVIAVGIGLAALIFFLSKRSLQKIHSLEIALSKSHASELNLKDEKEILQKKLSHTIEDPVTHVLGLQLFEDRLAQSIKESARFQLTMGLLFIDIDGFKIINQALGNERGDEILKEVAKRIQASVRQVDSVSRFHKDTFVVLLSQLSNPESAAVVVQRILQAISNVIIVNEQEIFLTACAGIALYPADGEDATTLFENAHHALLEAKQHAKHSYQFYQSEMHTNSQRELLMYTGIHRESIFQELSLEYQPVMNVNTKTILGMDVVLHWNHPTLGLIGAGDIFNLAVKQHKLNAITEWLLRKVCADYLEWQKAGGNPILFGIPFSIQQLESSQFIYRISQLLQEAKFNPEMLLLEIQDSDRLTSFDVLEKAFNMLRYLRIKVGIDHFGSNIFSLRHLTSFPIDYLKLDPFLIENLETNAQGSALIQSIVFMASKLNIGIIVQGVHSKEQVRILRELGCTVMQGSVFGPPLSEHNLLTRVTTSIEI